MVIAIEPMINAGTFKTRCPYEDGWTVYTADDSLSAHFERTIAITPEGPLVLTQE
jgi:methionyl aminopeptidase